MMAFATQDTGQGIKNKYETAQQQCYHYHACRLSDKYVNKWNRYTALNTQDPCSV